MRGNELYVPMDKISIHQLAEFCKNNNYYYDLITNTIKPEEE